MRGLPVMLACRRTWAAVLALAALGAGAAPAGAGAAELTATPSTFASVFTSAQAGDTIRLASGNYGTFRGALKSGMVTVTPQSGATATMALRLYPATNITLDGLQITDAIIGGTHTKNLIVRNSDFDGANVVFRGDDLVNANILFDNNKHSNVNVCSGCPDARVHIVERNESSPNGITIRNSRFYGGSADGIQNGGNGTRIIANTFRDLFQTGAGGAHTDSIQLYGSKNTLIKANFFYNVDMGNPGAYDRADHEIIEDNVVVSSRYPFQMQLLSDTGSIVRHNTFVSTSVSGGGCDYNLPCGIVRMGNKSVDPPSAGTVFKDNILAEISVTGSTPAYAENDYNLFTDVKGAGANSILGDPVYVGGANPTTYEGFALAAGSPGKGTASDGQDMGARIGASQPTPEPEPEPTPTGTTLFGTTTPKNTSARDGSAVELGVRFRADHDGQVTAIRFYKGSGNTGTHIGRLWTSDGTKLAEVTFTSETATGWQQATLTSPVKVTAGTIYVASYHAPNGGYSYDHFSFDEPYTNGVLRAPVNAGVYIYGSGGFPTNTHNYANYWVDVVFAEGKLPASPTASYTYSPSTPKVSQEVTFDATGSSCQASPCSYVWEDDGPDGPGGDQWPLGTGEVLPFTFSGAGDKHVRLTVTDAVGRSVSTVRTVTAT